jgi:hypothetical protein
MIDSCGPINSFRSYAARDSLNAGIAVPATFASNNSLGSGAAGGLAGDLEQPPDFGTISAPDNAPGLWAHGRFPGLTASAEGDLHPAGIGIAFDEGMGGRRARSSEVMCDQTTLGRLPR